LLIIIKNNFIALFMIDFNSFDHVLCPIFVE